MLRLAWIGHDISLLRSALQPQWFFSCLNPNLSAHRLFPSHATVSGTNCFAVGSYLHPPNRVADWRSIMGAYKDKAKGAANQAIGNAKVAIGKQTDNADLVAEGVGQDIKGKVQSAMGAAKGKLKHRL